MKKASKFVALGSGSALMIGAVLAAGPAAAQWGWGYGGYSGYGYNTYGYGGEGCGNINCEGDGWDGGYSEMKDAENAPEEAAEQKQFNKEFAVKTGRLCNSKTPTYNNWGDFTGYKAVKIPCK